MSTIKRDVLLAIVVCLALGTMAFAVQDPIAAREEWSMHPSDIRHYTAEVKMKSGEGYLASVVVLSQSVEGVNGFVITDVKVRGPLWTNLVSVALLQDSEHLATWGAQIDEHNADFQINPGIPVKSGTTLSVAIAGYDPMYQDYYVNVSGYVW